jgi:hypothetical protein
MNLVTASPSGKRLPVPRRALSVNALSDSAHSLHIRYDASLSDFVADVGKFVTI